MTEEDSEKVMKYTKKYGFVSDVADLCSGDGDHNTLSSNPYR